MLLNMRGLKKSKRVSWASDLNLCQVKLFLSDESPSRVGLGGEDDLQAKESHSIGAASDDNLPPGFEGIQPASLLKNKLSQIPLVEWKCPAHFILDPTWQVVAGEESEEVAIESQREMRVLEAVYPRPSAIPPNPVFPVDESYYDDEQTPLIPMTPIEDEDLDTSMASDTSSHSANGMLPPGVEPHVLSAAYSALNAAASSSQGSLIDPDLLIKILSNPTLIEKLVSTHGPAQPAPAPVSLPDPPPPVHVPFSSSGNYYMATSVPVSDLRPPPPPPPPPPEVKKDINYYKSLIQQHGEEKADPTNNPKMRDVKHKIAKPCVYFNSSRGCRHGANCVYLHDSSSQQRSSSLPEAQTAKRMKMDREITGT